MSRRIEIKLDIDPSTNAYFVVVYEDGEILASFEGDTRNELLRQIPDDFEFLRIIEVACEYTYFYADFND